MSAVVSFRNMESIHAVILAKHFFCSAGRWKRSCRNLAFSNCRTNCRGRVCAPAQPTFPGAVWKEHMGDCQTCLCLHCINPSIKGVIRFGHGSVTILQHFLVLVPAFSLAPLIFFLSLIFNACMVVAGLWVA